MGESRSLLGRIVTWTIIGVLAVVAIKIALRILGFVAGLASMAVGVVMFLLFTVGPVILVGWLVVKAWQAFSKQEPAL